MDLAILLVMLVTLSNGCEIVTSNDGGWKGHELNHLSNEEKPSCLGCIWDYATQLYGDYFTINHEIRILSLNNQYFRGSFFLFWVPFFSRRIFFLDVSDTEVNFQVLAPGILIFSTWLFLKALGKTYIQTYSSNGGETGWCSLLESVKNHLERIQLKYIVYTMPGWCVELQPPLPKKNTKIVKVGKTWKNLKDVQQQGWFHFIGWLKGAPCPSIYNGSAPGSPCSTNPCPFSPRHRAASAHPKPSCQDHCTRKFTKCQLTIKVNLNHNIWNYLGRKVMGFQEMDDRFNLYGYLKPWVVYQYTLILFVKSFVVRFLVSPCQNEGVNHFNWIFYETNIDKRCPWTLPKHSMGLVYFPTKLGTLMETYMAQSQCIGSYGPFTNHYHFGSVPCIVTIRFEC